MKRLVLKEIETAKYREREGQQETVCVGKETSSRMDIVRRI